jgi:flavin-dependent dehydrogenase
LFQHFNFVTHFTGIIGAGIGGASTAYFMRELFGDEAKIDLYERNLSIILKNLVIMLIEIKYKNIQFKKVKLQFL